LLRHLFYFSFLLHPNSIAPKTIKYSSPCAPHRSRVLSYPSPATPACIWLIVVFNRRLAAALCHDEFCFIFFLTPKFDGRNDTTASSPIVIVLHAVPPNYIPSLRPTFGSLLCSPIQWKPLKPKAPSLFLFLFFVRSIRHPKQRINVLTTRSTPAASPIQRPPCRRRRPSVGCRIPPSSGSHPRPVLRPSLIFFMGAISAPQSRESAAASVNRPPGDCSRLIGSRGAVIRVHGRCCHRERGQSRWG
jgi:hypothetical protein